MGILFQKTRFYKVGLILFLAKDEMKFQNIHSDVENVMSDLSFGLSSEGETLRIYSDEGLIVDSVSYLPYHPWPELANGQGFTLELSSPNIDNTMPENWANYRFLGSPGVSNDELSGISTTNGNIQINRYPNPFVDVVNLDISFNSTSLVSAKMYDQKGKFIGKVYDNYLVAGEHTISTDLSHLDKGLYILELNIGAEQETFQCIKF